MYISCWMWSIENKPMQWWMMMQCKMALMSHKQKTIIRRQSSITGWQICWNKIWVTFRSRFLPNWTTPLNSEIAKKSDRIVNILHRRQPCQHVSYRCCRKTKATKWHMSHTIVLFFWLLAGKEIVYMTRTTTRCPPIGGGRQNAVPAPLKFDPKPSEAAL